MNKRLISIYIFITTVFILFSFVVFAQIKQPVVFTFANSASPINNVTLFVIFPSALRPIDLTSGMTWNPGNRTLSVSIDEIKPYQELKQTIMVEGSPGVYQLQGRFIGQWSQIGQNFQSDIIAIEVKIQEPISESIISIIRRHPKVIAAAKNVAVPAAVTLEVIGGGVVVGTAVSSNASIAVNIFEALRFVRFIGFGLFRLRKAKPWGRIYNQITNKPIKGAIVRVFEATFQKLKDSQFTDNHGRFGFLVAPGTYYLTVSKPGFQDFKSDLITVKGGEAEFNINIGLISENTPIPQVKIFFKVISALAKIINRLSPIILIIGTLASLGVVIVLPTVFNFTVMAVYLLLDIFKIILSRRNTKSFGVVRDKKTQQSLPLAVVRIFDAERNWLLSSRVTDAYGRFKFLIVPGIYYITGAKEHYKPFVSKPIEITKAGVLNWEIILEPEG